MKNKTMRRLLYLVVAFAMALCLAFAACDDTPATVTATATFVGGTDATGTAPDPISVDAGTEITLPQNTFQKSGSAFDGWNDGAATYAEGAKYTLSKDTTFTALWKSAAPTPVTYTLTFALGDHAAEDAAVPAAQTLAEGATYTLPAAPKAADGYEFDGWGPDKLAAGATYTMPASNTTLTAQWKEVQTAPTTYTVTVSGEGFTVSGLNAEGYAAGASVSFTVTVTDTEKEIDSVTSSDVTVNKNSDGSYGFTMPEKNVTVTVTLKDKTVTPPPTPTTYTVTATSGQGYTVSGLNANYAAGANVSFTVTVTDTEKEIDSVTSADVTITDNGNGSYSFTMPEKDVTITVTLKNKTVTPPPATTYTLTFALGDHAAADAAVPAAQTLAEGATYTLPAAPKAAEGWQFDGWGSDKLAAGATYTMPASDTTLTAQWKEVQTAPTTYTVTFYVDETKTTQTVNKGETATRPTPDPTDPNGEKTFRYWADDNGTQFDFSTPITSDLALTAVFRICVTFDLDGGTGTQPAPVWEEKYNPRGLDVDLPAADGYAKGNQILTGWTDGEETYEPGATETFTKSTKLTAVWGEKPAEPKEYSISYGYGNLSEGETIEGKAPSSPTQAKEGTPFTFPACTWTRKGYTFAGWKVRHWIPDVQNYPADLGYWANITEDVYQPNQTYTMPSEPVQLLATWTKATVTLKFDANEGEGEMSALTFTYGDPFYSKISNLQRGFTYAGHTFVGWAYTAEGPALSTDSSTPYTLSAYQDYVVEENGAYTLTLYAIWEEAAPAPATDFSALCGVWTNGEHSIVLSEAGADDGYPIGSAIVDGSKFYLLVMTTTGLIDMDALMESEEELPDPIITYQGSTSITCNNITYTQKTALSQPTITAADLEGKWTTADGAASLTFAAGKVTYAYSAGTYNSTLLCVDKYAVISFSMGSLVLTLNEAKTELAQSSGRTFVKEQQTPPPAEQPDLKYVGEVQTTFGGMTVVFKSIEMVTGNDNYAKLTYTVDGTQHVDELKNDTDNRIYTFMSQTSTGTWPGTTSVSKWWKMYPLANPPFTKNASPSTAQTYYSVGLSTNGIDLVIALSSTGDLGTLRLEGAEEPEPVESTKYTGNVTFESNGFPKSATYIFTEISLLKDLSRATFTYTVDDGAPTTEEVALTIDEDNIYSFKLTKSGSVSLYLKVLDNGTLELLNTSFDTLGTFTKEGTVEPEPDPEPEPAANVYVPVTKLEHDKGSGIFAVHVIVEKFEIDWTTNTIHYWVNIANKASEGTDVMKANSAHYSGSGTIDTYWTFFINGTYDYALAILTNGTAEICDNSSDEPINNNLYRLSTDEEPQPEVKHTVTYELGDHAAEGATAPDAAEYAKDATVTVEAGVEGAAGYEFTGWSDGKGHTYTAGQTFTMPDEDVTLTAQYEAYTPTTKTLDDYLGVWNGTDNSDKGVTGIKIEKIGDVYKVSYELDAGPGEYTEFASVNSVAKKYLVMTAQKTGTTNWTLTMTFTADDTATIEINGVTSVFTRTEKGTPGTDPVTPKPDKPEDADGTYVNAEGTPEFESTYGGSGEYNFTSAELTGDSIKLVSQYPETVTLTWDGNEGNGEIVINPFSKIKVKVVAEAGKLTITFTYGNEDYTATFIKQASGSQGGGGDGGDGGDSGDHGDHGDSGDTQSHTLSEFFDTTFGYASSTDAGWNSTSDYGNAIPQSSNHLFKAKVTKSGSGAFYLECNYVNTNTSQESKSTKSYYIKDSAQQNITDGSLGIDSAFDLYNGSTKIGTVKFIVNEDGTKQITITIGDASVTWDVLA